MSQFLLIGLCFVSYFLKLLIHSNDISPHVGEAKFLGIKIDDNLTWKKQIDNVCKLLARNMGVLNKVKCFLPEQVLYKLHCLLILPLFKIRLISMGMYKQIMFE